MIRVTIADAPEDSRVYTALLLVGQIRSVPDVRRVRQRTPAELPVPPGDLCAVVWSLESSVDLLVEYEMHEGEVRRIYHRSRFPVALLLRRGARTFSGGLGATASGDAGVPTS